MKDYLIDEISNVWDEFKTDHKVFEEFVRAFHFQTRGIFAVYKRKN